MPREYYRKVVAGSFLTETGKPFRLTDGQCDIFRLVFEPEFDRVAIKTYTQYGKSDTVSMAIVSSLVSRIEKILIISPSADQSKIIMGYVIRHLFDNDLFVSALQYEGSLDQLKRERSKKRITLKHGSEVFILTANAREVSAEARNIMGFNATVVIVEESPLIPSSLYSKILRMAGSANRKRRIIQLGNAFESQHFKKAFKSKRYKKLSVDYKQGIKEGRITKEFIQEARETLTGLEFRILYDCEFPKEGAVNALIPNDWVDLAVNQKNISYGDTKAGLDVARFGDDKTVYCQRNGGVVEKLLTVEKKDTMEVVGWARRWIDEDEPEVTSIDTVGIGSGVYDRLKEEGYEVSDVNVGRRPISAEGLSEDEAKEKFYNLKAQMAWNLREWFKPTGGKSKISIPNDLDLIKELKEIRFNYDSKKRIKVESKEDIKKRIGRSPDKADALMLAFSDLTNDKVELYIG